MIKKVDTLANRLSYAMKMQSAKIDHTFEKIRKAAP